MASSHKVNQFLRIGISWYFISYSWIPTQVIYSEIILLYNIHYFMIPSSMPFFFWKATLNYELCLSNITCKQKRSSHLIKIFSKIDSKSTQMTAHQNIPQSRLLISISFFFQKMISILTVTFSLFNPRVFLKKVKIKVLNICFCRSFLIFAFMRLGWVLYEMLLVRIRKKTRVDFLFIDEWTVIPVGYTLTMASR